MSFGIAKLFRCENFFANKLKAVSDLAQPQARRRKKIIHILFGKGSRKKKSFFSGPATKGGGLGPDH